MFSHLICFSFLLRMYFLLKSYQTDVETHLNDRCILSVIECRSFFLSARISNNTYSNHYYLPRDKMVHCIYIYIYTHILMLEIKISVLSYEI